MASFEDQIKFMHSFGNVVTELSRLTGLIFINTRSNSKKPIDRSLRLILNCNNKGQFATRDYMLAKVALLVKNLKRIEEYDKRLFEKFKLHLLRSQNDNEYFGARFEIGIASGLIGCKVNFVKQESPDFKISENETLFLECTSSHIVALNQDINRKIEETIQNKSAKSYCTTKTALLIDVTNLFCRHVNNTSFSYDSMEKTVEQSLKNIDFGSVLLFFFYANASIYQLNCFRIDNKKINRSLASFLDKLLPIIGEIDPKWFPQEG